MGEPYLSWTMNSVAIGYIPFSQFPLKMARTLKIWFHFLWKKFVLVRQLNTLSLLWRQSTLRLAWRVPCGLTCTGQLKL